MEIYKEIKIYPDDHYGFSVENDRKDVGGEGITIQSFDLEKNGVRKNPQYLCLNDDEALAIADAIYELLKENKN